MNTRTFLNIKYMKREPLVKQIKGAREIPEF